MDQAAAAPSGGPNRVAVVGAALLVVWVASLTSLAGIGFNPTDDGFIVAQSSRILHGEVPHKDFVSPRPVGSPLLHTLDVALPTPLLMTSRAIALAELLMMSALMVRLVTRRVLAWGAFEVAATVGAALVALHTFPIMSWHTIDGLLLATTSLALATAALERQSRGVMLLAAAVAGFAPLVKQSFVFVPVAVAGYVVTSIALGRRRGWTDRLFLLQAVGAAAMPGLIYVLWVALAGGAGPLSDQLLGARAVDFGHSVVELRAHPSWLRWLIGTSWAGAAALALPWWRLRAASQSAEHRQSRLLLARLDAGLRVLCAALAVTAFWSMIDARLGANGSYGWTVWWLAVAAVPLTALRSPRAGGLLTFAISVSWMSSLSWGYAVPDLGLGLVLLTMSMPVGTASSRSRPQHGAPHGNFAASAVAVVVTVVLLAVATPARRTVVYRDVPAGQQVALGAIHPGAAGISANRGVAAYLSSIASCLESFPSERLAVLPDSPVIPLLFGKRNPLPVDWWYPQELPADRARLLDLVQTVDDQASTLFLLAPIDVAKLRHPSELHDDAQAGPPFDHDNGMIHDLLDVLPGTAVTCGPFRGRYLRGS